MTTLFSEDMLNILAACVVLIPAAGWTALLVANFFSLPWKETWVEALTRGVMVLAGCCTLPLAWSVMRGGSYLLSYGDWLLVGDAGLRLGLVVDGLSVTYLITAGFTSAIVGYFSARYLHRDPGYVRFFTLYLMFVSGINVVVLSAYLNTLIVGWELVGLSSVLLVGFYRERRGPVEGAMVVFTAYRLGDIGLHGLTASLPLLLGSDLLLYGVGHSPAAHDLTSAGPTALVCSLLLLLAAACKSAQGPFSVWLPRAMEGPTASSAIFYGALSVHLGAYLLLRTASIWRQVPVMPWLILGVGVATALYSAGVGRTRTDIKSLLAYAATAQLGLIFAEISLGLDRLALWHMVGHTMLRTLQFLRSPSAISDWLRFGRMQGWRTATEPSLESRLGPLLERKVYSQALFGWGLDKLILLSLVQPILTLGRHLDSLGRYLSHCLDGSTDHDASFMAHAGGHGDEASTPHMASAMTQPPGDLS